MVKKIKKELLTYLRTYRRHIDDSTDLFYSAKEYFMNYKNMEMGGSHASFTNFIIVHINLEEGKPNVHFKVSLDELDLKKLRLKKLNKICQ